MKCRHLRAPAALAVALALSLLPASRASTRRASVADYQVMTWTTAQGLPHPSVLAVAQTPDGYIWCGTEAGLARFDGVRFTVFDGQTTPELGNGQIRSLFVDRGGTLWITTRDARLVQFRDRVFTAYSLPRRASLNQAILNLADDDGGGLWLMPEDRQGMIRFVDGRFDLAAKLWPGGPASINMNIRPGFDGSVWISTFAELACREHGQVKVVLSAQSPGQYLFHAPSRSGGFWVSTAEGQIGVWRKGGWLWKAGRLPWNSFPPLQWGAEDNQSRLWLASFGGGVFCFDTNGVVLHFTTTNGLASDHTRHLLADREDNIWVATESGLGRIQPALFREFSRPQGLTADRVTGVFPAQSGGLWVGTDGGSLHRLQDGNLVRLTNGPAFPLVTAVLVDSTSNVWVGTRGNGLFHSTPQGFGRLGAAPLASEISALFEDSSNRLWVGQRSLNTVVHIDPDAVCRTISLPNPEPVVDVRCFAQDDTKALWIGTSGSGLFRWSDGRFEHFSRTNGLPSHLIWTLHFDPDDRALWIGTAGGGLARWKEGRFAVCDTAHGLWDDTICQMLDDGRGWFWFGSRRGIFRVSKARLRQFMDGGLARIHSAAYGESDGLSALVCSGGFQPAGCRTADGKLWFPTMQGLACIDSATVPTSRHPPVVQLERFLLNGEEVRDAPARSASDVAAPAFRIVPGAHRCEFQYTGLSFASPEAVQFRYRMEGLEPNWVEAGTARSAIYSRLPPGDYRFVVTAANRDGIWNEVGASLRLRVLPAIWQTGWFVSGCVLGGTVSLVGTGWLMARGRARRRLAALAKSRALDQERARIAKDIHDDLGTGLTHIAWLSELAVVDSSLPEKVQSHTRNIAEHARLLVESLDETVWAVSPENDSLESLVRYVSSHAHECLEAAGIGCRIDMPDRLPSTAFAAEVRHDLFLAMKEALNNLLKHAAARNVRILFAVEADSLVIRVEDDGHGFSAGETPRPGGGHGLENMRWRLERHGGEFACASTPGKGTRLMLRLPLRQEWETATDRARR